MSILVERECLVIEQDKKAPAVAILTMNQVCFLGCCIIMCEKAWARVVHQFELHAHLGLSNGDYMRLRSLGVRGDATAMKNAGELAVKEIIMEFDSGGLERTPISGTPVAAKASFFHELGTRCLSLASVHLEEPDEEWKSAERVLFHLKIGLATRQSSVVLAWRHRGA